MHRLAGVVAVTLTPLGALGLGCVGDDPVFPPASADAGGAPTDAAAPLIDGGTGSPVTEAGPNKIDRFLGTWTTATATQQLDCGGGPQQSGNIAITLEVERGTDSDIVATNTLARDCHLKFNVVGDTGTLLPNQVCQQALAGGRVDTYSYTPTSSLQISSDGTSASMQLGAFITSNAGPGVCQFSELAPYSRK